eukprot:909102-Amphidinium_carterae.1
MATWSNRSFRVWGVRVSNERALVRGEAHTRGVHSIDIGHFHCKATHLQLLAFAFALPLFLDDVLIHLHVVVDADDDDNNVVDDDDAGDDDDDIA